MMGVKWVPSPGRPLWNSSGKRRFRVRSDTGEGVGVRLSGIRDRLIFAIWSHWNSRVFYTDPQWLLLDSSL